MVLAGLAPAAEPIRLHPENPKYFLFRGKPLVLVTATEHYGSVINRAFNFERYLDGAAGKKMTLTRTFLLFREQQGSRNPASPCKPESPDFIAPITAGSEAGTPQSRAAIRSWMKHLSEFIHSFDFVHAKLASGWVKGLPGHVVTSGLAVDGNDYIAYLADAREITEPGAGEPIRGRVTLDLPAGRYAVSLYSPVTGEVSPAMFVSGGQPAALDLLPFRHDIVVRAQRLLPPVRVYADGRPATTLRMDAEDSGPIIRHGDGPGKCDYLGAREAIAFQAGDTYYLHYDGAGPRGWVACLATSKDLKKWDLRGPALELGAPGEDDSGTASSPWTIFDGKWWHMFYVACRNTTPPPNRIPAVPYFTRKARSRSPLGPWEKQRDVIPFDTKPETFYSDTASPGQIVKHNGEYLMFFSAAAGRPLKRTLGIARTRNLDGPWRIDANPALPPEQQVENSALYYEPSHQTWFLFTNHIGLDRRGEYTESIWVYWSKDINKWDPKSVPSSWTTTTAAGTCAAWACPRWSKWAAAWRCSTTPRRRIRETWAVTSAWRGCSCR
jgi:predicted GH43/DUF377 family glycosyl hydrolase